MQLNFHPNQNLMDGMWHQGGGAASIQDNKEQSQIDNGRRKRKNQSATLPIHQLQCHTPKNLCSDPGVWQGLPQSQVNL
jgi:hypothetical protein